jgi:hypothetical protein
MIAGFSLDRQQYVELQTFVPEAWSFRTHSAHAILTGA